ncbi:MAG: beta-aspartyl-peptidase [Clostridia bacterium]|nr:beta-aspartyl-peptidase [Clostridia bacterium]
MFKLIKNGKVYGPELLGKVDILISGNKIIKIDEKIDFDDPIFDVEVINAEGKIVVPGFIDQHVHIIGGGGEAGFHSRTPEVMLSNIVGFGITTLVGLLGTDGTTRHLESLLAKARALETEGVTTYIFIGSYELPTRTMTGSVRKDIVLIDKVIGAKIAISDHRSSQPTKQELIKLVEDIRVGGMLSGGFGIVVLHLGDAKEGLDKIIEVVDEIEIPIRHFLPTHVNRNRKIFEQSIQFAKMGGVIDITSGINSGNLRADTIKPSKAVMECIENKVPVENITMSSDGNGSLLKYNPDRSVKELVAASLNSLHSEFRDMVIEEGIELSEALKVITSNVAKLLSIYPLKGSIGIKSDADIVIMDENLDIDMVLAKGKKMMENGEVIVKGTFER